MSQVNIEESWKSVLADVFETTWFEEMAAFLRAEKAAGKTIYPPGSLIFQAFQLCPFHKVKVVVLGQDPYHNPGEAMGLSFSVPRNVRTPQSLLNIFKELQDDLGIPVSAHGDLSAWAAQGVFLLNAMLTVEKNKPQSHQHIGWQNFTDTVIQRLSQERDQLVFMLWGNYAKKKKILIDTSKHLILEAAHPSPLARGAFFGSKHFSLANAYFSRQGITPINWELPQ